MAGVCPDAQRILKLVNHQTPAPPGGEAEHSSSVSIVTTTRVFGKRARGSSGLKTWPSNVA